MARRHRSPIVLVTGATVRDVVGYVKLSDLLIRNGDWTREIQQLTEVNDTETHLTTITKLQEQRALLARVTDSGGRTIGIVNTERLLSPLLRER